MLYIAKEGLPDDINGKIIELRKSEEWKNINEDDTDAIRRVFDTEFPKNEVKEILLRYAIFSPILCRIKRLRRLIRKNIF